MKIENRCIKIKAYENIRFYRVHGGVLLDNDDEF